MNILTTRQSSRPDEAGPAQAVINARNARGTLVGSYPYRHAACARLVAARRSYSANLWPASYGDSRKPLAEEHPRYKDRVIRLLLKSSAERCGRIRDIGRRSALRDHVLRAAQFARSAASTIESS